MQVPKSVAPDARSVDPATNRGVSPKDHALFLVPARRGNELLADIRGRVIVLGDPADDPFTPTSDELFILSIASELAWSARRFLRAEGQATDVNLTVTWQEVEDPPRLADVSVTVAVPAIANTVRAALRSELEGKAATRSMPDSLRIDLHCDT